MLPKCPPISTVKNFPVSPSRIAPNLTHSESRLKGKRSISVNRSRSAGVERCLRSIPLCELRWDSAHASLLSHAQPLWQHLSNSKIFDPWIPWSYPNVPSPLAPYPLPIVAVTSDLMRITLLNALSIASKAFFFGALFEEEHLDFMFLTETWQRDQDFTHLNEICPQIVHCLEHPISVGVRAVLPSCIETASRADP